MMNKTELVNAIATETQLSKGQVKNVLEAMLNIIGEAIAKGDRIA